MIFIDMYEDYFYAVERFWDQALLLLGAAQLVPQPAGHVGVVVVVIAME